MLKVKLLDQDGNKKIDLKESFELITGEIFDLTDEKRAQRFFKALDVKNTGSINAADLKLLLDVFGFKYSEQETKKIYEGYDLNRDGKITFNGK